MYGKHSEQSRGGADKPERKDLDLRHCNGLLQDVFTGLREAPPRGQCSGPIRFDWNLSGREVESLSMRSERRLSSQEHALLLPRTGFHSLHLYWVGHNSH